jgi:ribosomal protein L7/L12
MSDDDVRFEDELLSLMLAGKKIEAIKRYRERTGADLAEAKEAVEALERNRRTASQPPGSTWGQDVVVLLEQGKKIKAIELVREHTGCGLKEAKDAVETIAAERHIVIRGSGCLGVVLLLVAALVGVAFLLALMPLTAQAQQPKPRAMVGAYYFDGWNGKTEEHHLTKLLRTKYADRKPVWGWRDDTLEIMQKQIDLCADHDIAFWAFDWYYPERENKTTPLNNALDLYLKTPNSHRLKFCLMVANHGGFRIGPKDWDACCQRWIELFKQPTHLRVGGEPLLIIFSPNELQKAFGGVDGVRQALDTLRTKAKQAGLPGVAVAACTGPGKHLDSLARSGYTLLTGYAYPLGWLNGGGSQPFQKLIDGGEQIFDQFAETTPLPYVPAITAGWDRRPWEEDKLPPEKMSVWYPDRTPKLVEEFVRLGVHWLDKHSEKTTPERLLLIYAWNENGEGGYLTPTATDGPKYLEAVQRAISGER